MSCEEWRDLIIDLVLDELEEDRRIRLEQHLADCPSCAAEERKLRGLLRLSFPPESYQEDPAMEARLLERAGLGRRMRQRQRIPDAGRSWARNLRGRWHLPRLLARPIPAYAVFVLVLGAVLAGLWAGQGGRVSPQADRATHPGPSLGAPDEASNPPEGFAGSERLPDSGRIDSSPRSWIKGWDVAFAIAPSDAIALVRPMSPDTL